MKQGAQRAVPCVHVGVGVVIGEDAVAGWVVRKLFVDVFVCDDGYGRLVGHSSTPQSMLMRGF